jgi:hypothetical protein
MKYQSWTWVLCSDKRKTNTRTDLTLRSKQMEACFDPKPQYIYQNEIEYGNTSYITPHDLRRDPLFRCRDPLFCYPDPGLVMVLR